MQKSIQIVACRAVLVACMLAAAILAAPVLGQPFVRPIGGTEYQDWTIVNYVDVGTAGNPQDYRGGNYTYAGHEAIDFTLPNFAAMDLGMPVLAADAGRVIEIHDGEPDRCSTTDRVGAWACTTGPNIVTILHDSGAVTSYWHLMRNSINVAVNQQIAPGQQIALVGSSGHSSDAHLHFEVYDNLVDYQNRQNEIETYEDPDEWWIAQARVNYADDVTGSLDHGITDHDPAPSWNVVELVERPADRRIFYRSDGAGQQAWFWANLHGIDAGDTLNVILLRPGSSVPYDNVSDVPGQFSYGWSKAGFDLPAMPDLGTWTFQLQRNGTTILSDTFTVVAQATTWQGGVSSNWISSGNWASGVVPGASVDGTRILNGGPFLTNNNVGQAQDIYIGSGSASAHGTLDLFYTGGFGGGILTTRNTYLGYSGQASSTARVVGASTWTNSGDLIVGYRSTGNNMLIIQAGGTVSSGRGIIGDYFGRTQTPPNVERTSGTANVDGAGSTWNSGSELRVGNVGIGTLNVTNGGHVTSAVGYVGVWASGAGTATINGIGSKWTNTGDLYVGSRSIAANHLNIQSGGFVSSNRGFIGDFASGRGEVFVDGSGSRWSIATDLRIGNLGSGTLRIQNGGTVTSALGRVSFAPGSRGAAIVSGPSSNWTMTGDLNVGGGGNGSLLLENGGAVTAPLGVTIAAGGGVAGNGLIATNNVLNSGHLNPGPADSPGLLSSTLSISGNYIQTSSGLLHIDLDTGNYGRLSVNGDITLAGTLDVDWIIGLPFWRPTVGDSFTILNWTGTRNGTFAPVELPILPNGHDWALQYNSHSVVLSVVAAGLSGDFNNDSVVDAADYIIWRKNDGTEAGFNDWKANFGRVPVASGTAAVNPMPSYSAPEPATVSLIHLVLLLSVAWRHRCHLSNAH